MYTSHPRGCCVWTLAGFGASVRPARQDVVNYPVVTHSSTMVDGVPLTALCDSTPP